VIPSSWCEHWREQAMMGRGSQDQGQLFYSFNLEEVVPDDHQVRAIAGVLDLSWVRAELAPHYSHTGRPSIDPVLMIRMLIVGYVFAIRSERVLCREVQLNLAYRWFCGLGIEDKVPDHSVFSRARNERFRDSDIFRHVFESIARSRAQNGTGISIRSGRVARSKTIWRRSTTQPTAPQATLHRSSSHHPILLPNGPARCAMPHSSPTPTTTSST
jgi:transposase